MSPTDATPPRVNRTIATSVIDELQPLRRAEGVV